MEEEVENGGSGYRGEVEGSGKWWREWKMVVKLKMVEEVENSGGGE